MLKFILKEKNKIKDTKVIRSKKQNLWNWQGEFIQIL